MRCAVIRPFIVVLIVGVLRHETFKESFEIASRRRCGIFHHHQTAAGVLNKYGHRSVFDLGSVDFLLNGKGDLVRSFAFCANHDLIVSNAHLAN